jgi:hypothetical protein
MDNSINLRVLKAISDIVSECADNNLVVDHSVYYNKEKEGFFGKGYKDTISITINISKSK